MKTLTAIWAMTLLTGFLVGCGENSKGPDQQITPPSSTVAGNEMPPADQVAVDKEPTFLKNVTPVYPELARKSGLEGKVWVKIWVDTEGKPRDVKILKSDSDVFNQVTIDAAKQFLFTPAYSGDKPVSVWVSVPFNFKLADKELKPASAGETSFMKGYIAAKENALAALEKEATPARSNAKPNAALEQKIQKARGELQTLKDALRAMEK